MKQKIFKEKYSRTKGSFLKKQEVLYLCTFAARYHTVKYFISRLLNFGDIGGKEKNCRNISAPILHAEHKTQIKMENLMSI